ncbi:subtilisin-like serine protease [Tulasnella sp. 419]|nr:subtilisin-like serine protease [Tulasnella sp. 419]
MSLGGAADEVLDKGVSAAVEAGVHVVVAAGNENVDAGQTSPARVPTVITVGAMGINDTRAKFSNFGEVVDVFAPGVDIISAWMGSPNATKKISGTSMATPHVAGLAAYLLSTAGPIAPAELATKIKTMAVTGALTEIPSGTTDALVQNA